MADHFNAYSSYYNLLYGSKDYSAEAEYIHTVLQKYRPGCKSILEFGSGTGGHGLLLRKKGYSVYGLELSETMVAQAQLNGFECEVADICNFRTNQSFDAVISLFHVLSYLTTNEQLIAAFTNAHHQLLSGGIFVFDVWYTPAVYNLRPETRKKIVENEEISVIRIAEPEIYVNRNVVDVNYHILVKNKLTNQLSEINEVHPMRHFSIPEISILAQLTGFEVITTEAFLTGEVPSEKTWGVCFVLKKIN